MQYLKNVSSLELDVNKCINCGICMEVCPHDVFMVVNKKSLIKDSNLCMECGACKMNCPVGAINVHSGVGCAAAIYTGIINKTEPTCACSNSKKKTSCC
jgi:NAD-dependent dihydropyrimidine dehydrogenase PreA subunit